MQSANSESQSLPNEVSFIPSDSDTRGVYLLSDPSDLGTDTHGSYSMEDCEVSAEVKRVMARSQAAVCLSVFSLGISLLILISIFLISW